MVFAAAVPPYLLKSDDNPDGPLTEEAAGEMTKGLEADRTTFFDGFTQDFFSADGELKVTEEQRQEAIALCHQSDQKAALGCMEAFGTTDFRDDLHQGHRARRSSSTATATPPSPSRARASAPTRRSPAPSWSSSRTLRTAST